MCEHVYYEGSYDNSISGDERVEKKQTSCVFQNCFSIYLAICFNLIQVMVASSTFLRDIYWKLSRTSLK